MRPLPAAARAAERRALDATTRANSLDTQAYSAGRHMQLSWETRPRPEAIRNSLAAIDAIETLRGLQDDADSSAELFSTWTHDYYWLSGRLLRDLRDGDLDLAFSITERLRARSLLDLISRSRNRPAEATPAIAHRRSILEAIVPVQRRLMDPALNNDDRRKTLQQLDELEHREQEAQRQIEIAANRRGAGTGAAFASLDAVQSALRADEALLSFQVGIWDTYEGEFGGGSWLIAVTRDGRSVYRIPDRAQLAPIVPVFTGLLARNDGAEAAAAARLYQDLLADALNALPHGIERLILVPDGPLHRLPFDALRADARSKTAGDPLRAGGRAVGHALAPLARRQRSSSKSTGAGVRRSRARGHSASNRRPSGTRCFNTACISAGFLTRAARAARSNGTSVMSMRSSAAAPRSAR